MMIKSYFGMIVKAPSNGLVCIDMGEIGFMNMYRPGILESGECRTWGPGFERIGEAPLFAILALTLCRRNEGAKP
jgi:hypothetical protein